MSNMDLQGRITILVIAGEEGKPTSVEYVRARIIRESLNRFNPLGGASNTIVKLPPNKCKELGLMGNTYPAEQLGEILKYSSGGKKRLLMGFAKDLEILIHLWNHSLELEAKDLATMYISKNSLQLDGSAEIEVQNTTDEIKQLQQVMHEADRSKQANTFIEKKRKEIEQYQETLLEAGVSTPVYIYDFNVSGGYWDYYPAGLGIPSTAYIDEFHLGESYGVTEEDALSRLTTKGSPSISSYIRDASVIDSFSKTYKGRPILTKHREEFI